MGLISPTLPDVDLGEWRQQPYLHRIKTQVLHWAENGFGSPVGTYFFYIIKMAAYVLIPAWIIADSTPGLGGLGNIESWWTEPIVLQKFIVFTILFEVLGFGSGSGPLTMRFLPPIGSMTYWLRPGTLRLPPWPNLVPFTKGDQRSIVDVALYGAVIGSLVWGLISDGVPGGPGNAGLLDTSVITAIIASIVVMGLRDKTVYLACRSDQYLIMVIAFLFPFVDMIVALKLVMVAVWWGAATSKLNHHFPYVVSVMVANGPLRPKWLKRRLFKNFPTDMRPSRLSFLLAHSGTVIEYCVPAVLLFSQGGWLTTVGIAIMVVFHLHIISAIPAGVPLEWNIFVIVGATFLFGHYDNGSGYWLTDLTNPLLVVGLLGAVVVMIVIGNTKPAWISFLHGMRYYAGNWDTTMWIMRPGVEDILDEKVTKSAKMTIKQLNVLYDSDTSEFLLQKAVSWRTMHATGRALIGIVPRAVERPDDYIIREGEFHCGALLGWNFGEGHLHDEQMIEALQRRCQFADGDVRVIVMEAQPIHRQSQRYRIVDAATGVIEEGVVRISDLVNRQPWLDDDYPTIPVQVTWRRPNTPSQLTPVEPAPGGTTPPHAEV